MKKINVTIAVAGLLGAVAPALSQFASSMKSESFVWPNASFYIGLLIIGALGAGVVWLGGEQAPWKAFMQGIGAPALFSSAGSAATVVSLMVNIMPAAYAQNDSLHETVVLVNDSLYAVTGKESIEISKDGLVGNYFIPEGIDTLRLRVKVIDPVIRRGFAQAIMPMSAMRFDKRLVVEQE